MSLGKVQAAPAAPRMVVEAAEAPAAVRAQLAANQALVVDLAARLRRSPPSAAVTIARGSSDNAATFARYLIETRLSVLTASAPPSVASLYEASPAGAGALVLAISQSGESPDLLAAAHAARRAGALTVALVNEAASPLAETCEIVIPLHAGRERAVAATKSFITTLSAILQLVASWAGDDELEGALGRLPERLEEAWRADWSAALTTLARAQSLFVLGRGPGLAAAQEAALKLKEACGLHAEAFSAAEVRHGPAALVGPDLPVLAFSQDDETEDSMAAELAHLISQGAQVFAAGPAQPVGAIALPCPPSHPALAPALRIQSLYRLAGDLALARGLDPDRPAHLAKVTRTL